MSITLWTIVGTAIAFEGCGYPRGERHALLGFVTDPDRDLASDRLVEELAAIGWRDVVLTRSGTIASDLSSVTNDVVRQAAKDALENGWGVVVYSDAIDPEDSGSRQ